MIKTPKFWTKRNAISFALLPLSFLYLAVFYFLRFRAKKGKISKPIICVGNLISGGSGKTPTAIALGKILQEIGVEFAYLSRGFMGKEVAFLRIRNGESKSDEVGDEPLLLSEVAPTFVCKNRLFGARQIELMKEIEAIILDDGLQNNSLESDFKIVVVDGQIGFGNEFPIPAGPMRELPKSGLKKADLVILIGETAPNLKQKLPAKKTVQANILPLNIVEFEGKKLLAFCGLAYPQKFFNILKKNHLDVVEEIGFADHFSYQESDLEKIVSSAKNKGLTAITTKKDWVKFPQKFKDLIAYFDIELRFEDQQKIRDALQKILKK